MATSLRTKLPTRERFKNLTLEEKETYLGLALILPSLLVIGLIIIYPLLYNVYLSFTEVPLDPTKSPTFIGLENYTELYTSSAFWDSLKLTVLFSSVSAALATILGIGIGILLNRDFRGQKYVRSLIILPFIAPIVAVAFTWRLMLHPGFGHIPYFIEIILPSVENLSLLDDTWTALWTVIVYDAWRYYPFAFLMILARLQSIPKEMYEAARLDGASRLAQFKDITLPELRRVIATVFLLRMVWNFNTFTDVWLLTHNVPTLPIYTYQTAFSSFDQGLAAAISILLFLFLITFVTVYTRFLGEW